MDIAGAPMMEDGMVEHIEDQDEQIERMADVYARRTTERTGRKQAEYTV